MPPYAILTQSALANRFFHNLPVFLWLISMPQLLPTYLTPRLQTPTNPNKLVTKCNNLYLFLPNPPNQPNSAQSFTTLFSLTENPAPLHSHSIAGAFRRGGHGTFLGLCRAGGLYLTYKKFLKFLKLSSLVS